MEQMFWKRRLFQFVPLLILVVSLISQILITGVGIDTTSAIDDVSNRHTLQQFYQVLYWCTIVMPGVAVLFSILLLKYSGKKLLPVIGLVSNGGFILFYLIPVIMITFAVIAGLGIW